MAKKKKAKKAKRGAPRSQKWLAAGCEGVDASGRMRPGWRPPSAKGKCPRPGKAAKGRRASKARGCTPMIKKGHDVGYKRGFQTCWKEVPSDVRARIVGKVLAAEPTPHKKCVDWDEHEGKCRDKPAWSAGMSKAEQDQIRKAQRRGYKGRFMGVSGALRGSKPKRKSKKKGFFAQLFGGKR